MTAALTGLSVVTALTVMQRLERAAAPDWGVDPGALAAAQRIERRLRERW